MNMLTRCNMQNETHSTSPLSDTMNTITASVAYQQFDIRAFDKEILCAVIQVRTDKVPYAKRESPGNVHSETTLTLKEVLSRSEVLRSTLTQGPETTMTLKEVLSQTETLHSTLTILELETMLKALDLKDLDDARKTPVPVLSGAFDSDFEEDEEPQSPPVVQRSLSSAMRLADEAAEHVHQVGVHHAAASGEPLPKHLATPDSLEARLAADSSATDLDDGATTVDDMIWESICMC